MPPVVVQTLNRYPPVPQSGSLMCDAEAAAGADITTDAKLAQWAEALRQGGGDCRAKLEALQKWIAGWPKM
jgi:hypothetical protein